MMVHTYRDIDVAFWGPKDEILVTAAKNSGASRSRRGSAAWGRVPTPGASPTRCLSTMLRGWCPNTWRPPAKSSSTTSFWRSSPTGRTPGPPSAGRPTVNLPIFACRLRTVASCSDWRDVLPPPKISSSPSVDGLPLPGTHLVRVNLVTGGDLLHRPVSPQRLGCAPPSGPTTMCAWPCRRCTGWWDSSSTRSWSSASTPGPRTHRRWTKHRRNGGRGQPPSPDAAARPLPDCDSFWQSRVLLPWKQSQEHS